VRDSLCLLAEVPNFALPSSYELFHCFKNAAVRRPMPSHSALFDLGKTAANRKRFAANTNYSFSLIRRFVKNKA
jgi:hypothetical protein